MTDETADDSVGCDVSVRLFLPGISLFRPPALGVRGGVFLWAQSYKITITCERNCYLMRYQSASRAVIHFIQYQLRIQKGQNKILVEDPTSENLPCNDGL